MQIKSYWASFVSILFPPLCVSCEHVLLHQEEFICTSCQFHLPINDHVSFEHNEITQRLLGKAPIEKGAAYLSFSKSSLVQAMMHKLKYRKDYRVGKSLGSYFGEQLLASPYYAHLDVVIPLPLHPKKKRVRGYNQSEYIARGIAEAMSLPVDHHNLGRVIQTETQTKKSRLERYDNVENAFSCAKPSAFENRHVLLVDDVFTTGATIASAARTLVEQCDCKVSVAVLAIA